jgi:hypothetical protein
MKHIRKVDVEWQVSFAASIFLPCWTFFLVIPFLPIFAGLILYAIYGSGYINATAILKGVGSSLSKKARSTLAILFRS